MIYNSSPNICLSYTLQKLFSPVWCLWLTLWYIFASFLVVLSVFPFVDFSSGSILSRSYIIMLIKIFSTVFYQCLILPHWDHPCSYFFLFLPRGKQFDTNCLPERLCPFTFLPAVDENISFHSPQLHYILFFILVLVHLYRREVFSSYFTSWTLLCACYILLLVFLFWKFICKNSLLFHGHLQQNPEEECEGMTLFSFILMKYCK